MTEEGKKRPNAGQIYWESPNLGNLESLDGTEKTTKLLSTISHPELDQCCPHAPQHLETEWFTFSDAIMKGQVEQRETTESLIDSMMN